MAVAARLFSAVDVALKGAALSWCAAQGTSPLLLDRDGSILSAFTPDAESDATLCRAQYLAALTGYDPEPLLTPSVQLVGVPYHLVC
jgi:hypothetical protein